MAELNWHHYMFKKNLGQIFVFMKKKCACVCCVRKLVCWCFEPGQPREITSGLMCVCVRVHVGTLKATQWTHIQLIIISHFEISFMFTKYVLKNLFVCLQGGGGVDLYSWHNIFFLIPVSSEKKKLWHNQGQQEARLLCLGVMAVRQALCSVPENSALSTVC